MAKVNAVPFHEKEYWKNRFEKEKHFEWLVTWDDIKKEFEPYLNKDEDVLHLGCGNSELAFDLADSGYKTVVNVDYAENVIEYMKSVTHEKQQQNSNYSNISWISGDCLNNLKSYLPKSQYSIIIDKSLVDTIACGDDDQQSRVKQLSTEMLSVAKPDAYWLSISFSGEREFYIDNEEQFYWKTEQRIPIQVAQPNDKPGAPAIYYYLYINHKMSA
ncbi:uncharacterized protein ATC70_006821 [Mucor velutinosus]|uniref:Methyltransferase domain-containing protein n=1 Tax=Mucor velutinosus TaxID=708070 RepID=A0AAN7DPG2_9FUNG|nr:hypothetical protein ATC70_006821 [Mucor velutinosus]